MVNLPELDSVGCIDELDARLKKIHGTLSLLNSAMFNLDLLDPEDIQHAVVNVIDMTKECMKIKDRIHALASSN